MSQLTPSRSDSPATRHAPAADGGVAARIAIEKSIQRMSAIENPIVAPGPAYIENEQEADLGGERRLPAGGGIQDVVEANATQVKDTVEDAVPKAETPVGDDQAHAEANSGHVDGSSSADNSSDTLTNGIDDEQLKGNEKGSDSNMDSDSDSDSDGSSSDDSGDDFFTRYQSRGPAVYGDTGKPAPADSGLKSPKIKPSNGRSTAQSTSQAQKPTTTDSKSRKTDNKSSKTNNSGK
ncbi:hypothetical protein EWM64_g1748 [Hericium alpestre]|uniref:Uncharacterized protein n=1 Tax=Hericium alpestre TaxID=135208 RepID=A0A4Z0A7I4_9AGAM|nr:hypothetical protein EWM64_g1748 [Hericium alpestre]